MCMTASLSGELPNLINGIFMFYYFPEAAEVKIVSEDESISFGVISK